VNGQFLALLSTLFVLGEILYKRYAHNAFEHLCVQRKSAKIRQFYGRKCNYVLHACTVNTCDILEVKNAVVKSVCCVMETPSAVLLYLVPLSVRESRDTWSQGSSVAIMIRPRAGRPEVRIPAGTRDVFLFQRVQTGCRAPPPHP